MNVLFLIGICLVLGLATTKITDKFSIPHVVGFILLGVLLGGSFLNIFSYSHISDLGIFSDLALGFIGFGMGEHLHRSQLRLLGKSIIIIAFLEAFGAFFFVFLAAFLLTKSIAIALIFGSLAAATDPAATVDVIKQYKTRGELTTTLLAVIGIDDAIALFLYSLAVPIAFATLSTEATLSLSKFLPPFIEIGGSILLGIVLAFPIDYFLDVITNKEEELLFAIAAVILVIGLAITLHFSVILTTLVLGACTINLKHRNAKYISRTLERVGPILYIMFFILVGANMNILLLPKLGIIGFAYILFRGLGKIGGSYLGGKISKAKHTVQKYLGLALFPQAGVAVGLALSLSTKLSAFGPAGIRIKELVVPTIIATTLVIQVIGPLLTKYALFASGEAKK